MYRVSTAIALSATMLAAACAKDSGTTPAVPTEKKADAAPAVTPTGRTITIEAYSDGAGNYFKPAQVEAHRGDVLRFVLKSGVHNINFLPDSNPGAKFLPAASEMLQLPEQTYDLIVSFEKGSYYFQCDPHAALGMVGRIKVED
jgi:plastocyanin